MRPEAMIKIIWKMRLNLILTFLVPFSAVSYAKN